MLRKRFNSVLAATLLTVATTGTALAVGDPKATGDILGRDLSWPLAPAGHVGIWTGSDVLEVGGFATPVIRKTSLSSFKTASKYWGASYGKGSNLYKVIDSGWAQRAFSPQYTVTTQWQEGKKEWKCLKSSKTGCQQWGWVVTPAKFRCDTFVWYAYKKGIGFDLLGGDPASIWVTSLPRTVYYSMPSER